MLKFNRFKEGKKHVLTMSYDDGKAADRRLVELFQTYGIKGTFHLNSGLFDTDGYIRSDEVDALYTGHEVSCHTVHHPHLAELPGHEAALEVLQDRKTLENLCNYPVTGMSYPFGTYNDTVVAMLKACGIQYSRTTKATGRFDAPKDFLKWHPTCHHRDAMDCLERFMQYYDSCFSSQLFYVWGHSYEFDRDNNWDMIEKFCRTVSRLDNVWFATNIEIYDYLQAIGTLKVSANSSIIYNPSSITIWAEYNGNILEIPGGKTTALQ